MRSLVVTGISLNMRYNKQKLRNTFGRCFGTDKKILPHTEDLAVATRVSKNKCMTSYEKCALAAIQSAMNHESYITNQSNFILLRNFNRHVSSQGLELRCARSFRRYCKSLSDKGFIVYKKTKENTIFTVLIEKIISMKSIWNKAFRFTKERILTSKSLPVDVLSKNITDETATKPVNTGLAEEKQQGKDVLSKNNLCISEQTPYVERAEEENSGVLTNTRSTRFTNKKINRSIDSDKKNYWNRPLFITPEEKQSLYASTASPELVEFAMSVYYHHNWEWPFFQYDWLTCELELYIGQAAEQNPVPNLERESAIMKARAEMELNHGLGQAFDELDTIQNEVMSLESIYQGESKPATALERCTAMISDKAKQVHASVYQAVGGTTTTSNKGSFDDIFGNVFA